MSALLALLATAAGKYVAGAIGAAVVLIAAYLRGRKAGISREQGKQASAEADAIKTRKDVDDEIDRLGPADVDARYRRWVRGE